MSKRKTSIIVKDKLDEHPAALAWSQLGADLKKLEAIEVIRDIDSSKNPVFRLMGVGENGNSVIAKKAQQTNAMTERCIYENVLSSLSKATLHYYGYVEAANQTSWIFIEDSCGNPFSFKNDEHVALAIEWLAELHTSATRHDCLPDRGLEYYYTLLVSAHNVILQNLSNIALREQDRELLGSIIYRYDYLMHQWDMVQTLYEQMPKGLIHGDFKPKNLRVRKNSYENTLLVFDWEDAGWGLPGIDMWKLHLEDYWGKIRDHWHDVTFKHVVLLSHLGKLLWCLSAIDWATTCLPYQWLETQMDKMRIYEERLAEAIHAISSH